MAETSQEESIFLYDKTIKEIFLDSEIDSAIDSEITLCGWIKTARRSKEIGFVALNDGTTQGDLQIVFDLNESVFSELFAEFSTGVSLQITGKIVASQGKGQKIEIQAKSAKVFGGVTEDYPLQKKRHSFEFLREITHLRARTNTFSAMNRVRSRLSFAIHEYFQSRDFHYIHTPLITSNDAEGGGQMFRVTVAEDEKILKNPEKDFFGKKSFLTVSGQLALETHCLGLGKVYTFGPTFRAENSNTARHAAEFWMIEPEIAFCELPGLMNIAEDFLKNIIAKVLSECSNEIDFFNQWVQKGVREEIENTLKEPFARITYTEAIEILEKSSQSFEFPVSWGIDLASEHERYLCEMHFKRPVILSNYPSGIKAFYMRQNDNDGDQNRTTVRAMDILFPRIGEVIGGSEREARYDVLCQKLEAQELALEDYAWYLDLRRYGSVPHSGFGLGLERLLMFLTGLGNIRDVLPFPRTPQNCLL